MPIVKCRACNGEQLQPVLSLGRTPLANALAAQQDQQPADETWPLDLVFCPDCTLVQITETVPPETLFREYVYFSSFSDTMLKHAESLVGRMCQRQSLGPRSLAMEIASNDGYLLQYYLKRGIPVLGIEPATNIAQVAREERGINTVCEFFGLETAKHLVADGYQASVLHAHNVLAHVADLPGVVEGMRVVLAPDGVAVIEAPYILDLIEHCEFDTIYHEHLCYFSLTALDRLFREHQLQVLEARRVPIHGGSLQLVIGHVGQTVDASVAELLEHERECGLQQYDYYVNFGSQVKDVCLRLRTMLEEQKKAGKRLAAYGASAKGTTLLHAAEIGPELLDFVVDRSTVKQGQFTPGTRLPILPPERLVSDKPDAVLLLTWNFADEILEQQAEYRRQGGKFIIPVPEPREV